jgi:hypothetical protein
LTIHPSRRVQYSLTAMAAADSSLMKLIQAIIAADAAAALRLLAASPALATGACRFEPADLRDH